jgi:hypothetical protein
MNQKDVKINYFFCQAKILTSFHPFHLEVSSAVGYHVKFATGHTQPNIYIIQNLGFFLPWGKIVGTFTRHHPIRKHGALSAVPTNLPYIVFS